MQAVSFMYVRPPGYNAESAKAAEIADERKKPDENDPTIASSSSVYSSWPITSLLFWGQKLSFTL